MKHLMLCGHAENAKVNGKPCCAICFCIYSGADKIDPNPPSLEGRNAICTSGCGAKLQSSTGLAFFEHCPNSQMDLYYCGCVGWS